MDFVRVATTSELEDVSRDLSPARQCHELDSGGNPFTGNRSTVKVMRDTIIINLRGQEPAGTLPCQSRQ